MVSRYVLYQITTDYIELDDDSNWKCVAGEGTHGGTAEHAWVDLSALESSETTVASQAEQRGTLT